MQTLENLLRVSMPMSGRPLGGRQTFQFFPNAFSTIPVVLYPGKEARYKFVFLCVCFSLWESDNLIYPSTSLWYSLYSFYFYTYSLKSFKLQKQYMLLLPTNNTTQRYFTVLRQLIFSLCSFYFSHSILCSHKMKEYI